MAGARNMLDETFSVDDPEDKEPEAPEDEAPAEGGEEPAPAAARTPVGRRGRAAAAQAELVAKLDAITNTVTTQGETYRQELERISRENAELRGHVQGLASRPAQSQERQPEAPDPDKLIEEANKLLDAKDFAGYQRKFLEAAEARAVRAIGPRIQQQAQPSGPARNPMMEMVAGQYVDVMSDPVAWQVAQSNDAILAAQGLPAGPDRWKRAFEEGRRYKAGKENKAPTFDPKARGSLAAVPTARNGGEAPAAGGNGPGITLTPLQRQYAKKFKMTETQYAQHLAKLHPELVES